MKDDSIAGTKLFLVAGEPSGDGLGAALMARLRDVNPGFQFTGVGGPLMAAEGLDSLFPIDDLAVMGLAEVVPRLPRIFRRLRQTAAAVENQRPAAVITIDAPDFNMRLAARLAGQAATRDIPRIHYVAPSVWAWRPARAVKMARLFHRVLTLLPFEPPFFEKAGLNAVFVGHPAVERPLPGDAGERFRAEHAVPRDAPLLCLLPGSRRGEIARHGPIFYRVVQQLGRVMPRLRIVAPTLESRVEQVQTAFSGSSPPIRVVSGEDAKWGAFAACNVALAASGTVILELALAGAPAVIAYRVNPLTGFLARRLIQAPYVSLINLVADKAIHPEFLQGDCKSARLADACLAFLRDPVKAAGQAREARSTLEALGLGGAESPSQRAARAVTEYLDDPSKAVINGGNPTEERSP